MRPGRAADHSPVSSAAVMEEYSFTCTHPLGHTGPVTGTLNLYLCRYIFTLPYALMASTGKTLYIILKQLQAKQIKKGKRETNVPVHSVKEKWEWQYGFIYC